VVPSQQQTMIGQLWLNFPSGTIVVSSRKIPDTANVSVKNILLKIVTGNRGIGARTFFYFYNFPEKK
jgi:hypothetical protein